MELRVILVTILGLNLLSNVPLTSGQDAVTTGKTEPAGSTSTARSMEVKPLMNCKGTTDEDTCCIDIVCQFPGACSGCRGGFFNHTLEIFNPTTKECYISHLGHRTEGTCSLEAETGETVALYMMGVLVFWLVVAIVILGCKIKCMRDREREREATPLIFQAVPVPQPQAFQSNSPSHSASQAPQMGPIEPYPQQ